LSFINTSKRGTPAQQPARAIDRLNPPLQAIIYVA
jgi:hypothetical protein